MELKGERFIPATREQVWKALNDPAVLKECVVGCESIEPSGENAYVVLMTARVGPVSAKFKGRITLSDLNPPTSYTLAFDGQGGVAGFGKGSANIALKDATDASGTRGTLLNYSARAQVGGKLAQIGSRLVDSAAAGMADQFFARFVKQFDPAPAVAAAAPAAAPQVSFWTKLVGWFNSVFGGKEQK
jgi:carbon monoxide dehydrogenase subunit G